MAYATSFITTGVKRPSFTWLSELGAGVWDTLSMAILHMQVGRMKSVLHQMSDSDLEHIGITRSQINAYAETLMDV